MIHYHCKACEQRWCSNDCWCPSCGKITKADPKEHGYDNWGRKPKEPEKWTLASQREKRKRYRSKRFYTPYKG